MTWEIALTGGVTLAVLLGLAANRSADALLIGALIVLLLSGILSPAEAFAGFSNTGMLTVAALFVVTAALRETGALDTLGGRILGTARTERGVILRLTGFVPLMSAFLNNTPIVAMFIPVLTSWCKRNNVAPSRLLIPLSYLTILGGTCTLIGTSTNLVVQGMMRETVAAHPEFAETLRPMGLFEIGAVGLPYAVIGIAFLFLFGPRLLPERKDLIEQFSETAREYMVNLRISAGCRLAGVNVEDAGLRRLPGLYLIQVDRDDYSISPVTPDLVLAEGDTLTFTGVVSTIVDLEAIPGLIPITEETLEAQTARRREHILCEAVVSPTSPCLGKTIRDADFRALYNAAVVAVHRGGERLSGKVGDIVLRAGDALLLQAGAHFARAHRNNGDFILVSGIEDSRPIRSDRTLVALGILALLIGLMATGVVEVVTAAFLAAGLMVVTRCISMPDVRRTMEWQTLLTIAAAFGVGKALENAGAVELVVSGVMHAAGAWGPWAALCGVYLVTAIVTELVTNNAAAAIVFPFAVSIAEHFGVSPRPFVMAVALAASACFMTPIGYQTNMMVFGPGGYRFSDYLKIGAPFSVTLWIAGSLLIPLIWPF